MTFDQATPTAPVFPPGQLDTRAELLLGSTWTDISQYIGGPITIQRGHADESTQTSAATVNLPLFNGDGRFSHRNVNSPYFGKLGRNTQLRLSVPEGISYLRSESDAVSYAQCPAKTLTGTLDIQIDAALNSWSNVLLMGQWDDPGSHNGWMVGVNPNRTMCFFWASGASAFQQNSTAPLPAVASPQRMCLRVTYNPATGALAFFYTTTPGLTGATWTQLGSTFTFGSGFGQNASTAPVQLGYLPNSTAASAFASTYAQSYATYTNWFYGFSGKIYAAQVSNAGSVVINPDFTAQAAGSTSFSDSSGNTWTLSGTTTIDNRKYRFHGEVPAWPQKWGIGGNDVTVDIEAAGLLRRIGRIQNPANSTMNRAMTKLAGANAVVAYWPFEDGQFSTQIASGLAGGTPMSISGAPQLAANSSFLGSAAIPVVNGASFQGDVPAYSSAATTIPFLFIPSSSEATGATGYTVFAAYFGGGSTYNYAEVNYFNLSSTSQEFFVNIYPQGSSTPLVTFTAGAGNYADAPLLMALQVTSTTATLYWYSARTQTWNSSSAPQAATVGNVTRVQVNQGISVPGQTVTPLIHSAVGHIGVAPSALDPHLFTGPINAWTGEYAGMRFQRLCLEEGIPFIGRGCLTDSVQMGVQSMETISQLLQECVDSDQSTWVEPRGCAGFGFRSRVTSGNQSPAIAFDYLQDHLSGVLEPTEDDQTPINDVTVTQTSDGSSSRQVKTTGPLSVNGSPNGIGRYDTQDSVNIQFDSQLPSVCNWILWKSTVDEPRYPGIECDLNNQALPAAMQYAAQDADLGDRITIANPPPWLPPGPIDQLIQQTNETLFIKQFQEKWVCIPAKPWSVAYYDDPVYGRYDTAGAALSAALSASLDTNPQFSVQDLSGALAGSLNGWTGFNGTTALDNSVTFPGGPFPWSAVLTTTATGGALEGSPSPFAVTAANVYAVSAWVFFPAGGTVAIGVDWNGSGGFLSTSTVNVTVPAATWTPIGSGGLTAPAGAIAAYPRVGPPGSGQVLAVQGFFAWKGAVTVATSSGPIWTTATADFPFAVNVSPVPELSGEEMIVTGISGGSSPQTFTVVRGANGVCPAQASGSDVRLFFTPVYSL